MRKERIIAVNSNCYHGFSIEEAIAGIKKAGFRYIELTATKGWTEHVFPDQSFARLLEVKDMLDEAGLIPFAMSGHTNLMDTERIGDFVRNIRLAHFFGCDYIVSSIGEAHLEDKAVASNAVVAQHVRDLVPYLEEYDMTLVLETHGEHGTGAILKEIVELVDSPRVLINYDTANAIFYGDVDVTKDFLASMDKIGYVHLKDKAAGRQEWNFPALGKGYIDFPALFDALDADNNTNMSSGNLVYTDTYADGGIVSCGGLTFRVLHTPGHTPGSVCLQCEGALFTGDTLFAGSYGRTDFIGGDEAAMRRSLARLGHLEGDCTVLPGHGEDSTLDYERRTNPYLREAMR